MDQTEKTKELIRAAKRCPGTQVHPLNLENLGKITNFAKCTDITAKSAVSRRFERYTTLYITDKMDLRYRTPFNISFLMFELDFSPCYECSECLCNPSDWGRKGALFQSSQLLL